MRSIRENIWTAVSKYGPNEVRSVRKAKVQIFSRMDRTKWPIRALLCSHKSTLRIHTRKIDDKLDYNDKLHIRPLLECFHFPKYFPIPLSHLKRSFHSKNQNLLKKSHRPFCLFIDVGLRFSGPIRLFGGPIRRWTDR